MESFKTGLRGGVTDFSFDDPGGGGGNSSKDAFKLWEYEAFDHSSDNKNGLSIRISHNLVSGYSEFGWIQSVTTSNPASGLEANKPYNDYKRGDPYANPPFYYGTGGDSKDVADKGDYNYTGKFFGDGPARKSSVHNYYWLGELSLVGFKSGKWHNVHTFKYGFINLFGTSIPLPFMPVRYTSSFQQSLIDGLNKK